MASRSPSAGSNWTERLSAVAASTAYRAVVYGTLAFLLAPLAIVLIMSLQTHQYGQWPPGSFTLKWYLNVREVGTYLGIPAAFKTSVLLGVATAIISTIIGGFAAFAIVRYDFRYSTLLESFLISPLIYPWIVVGFSILLFIGTISSELGVVIELTFWTLLAGHVIFTLPYPIRTIGASLQNYDYSLEEAAQNLGATELESYLRITVPVVWPGILSAIVFVFVLSFNQYIISLFLSSPGSKTLPLLLFSIFYNQPAAQVAAIASLLMVGTLTIVFITEYVTGISEYL